LGRLPCEEDAVERVVSERITMTPPPPRLERVTSWIAANNLDALVVTGPALVTWLTGYSRYYGGPTAAVVTPAGHRTLVALRDEVAVAERLSGAEAVVGFSERGFGLELNPLPLLAAEVLAAVGPARRIGVAGDFAAAVTAAGDAEAVEADDALHRMSLVKDGDELTRIFRSYEMCWLAHTAIAEGAAAGASEIEMMSAAQAAAQVGHGSPVEFVADVLAGPNTAEVCAPVAIAGPGRAGPGQPVVADLSVGADGYWADTCRTYTHGSSAEIDEMRAQLFAIMDAAAAEMRPGATGAHVFGVIRDGIAAAWPDGEFPHHGGHGVGLTVFDDPHIIPAGTVPLDSWMVMAVEPGVYLPARFGVRCENLFLVTPDGAVELAQAMARPLSPQAQATWSR
jgi:Xaa-Pro dipeptidase